MMTKMEMLFLVLYAISLLHSCIFLWSRTAILVLMSIDTGLNTATNVKIYGGFITAFTAIYMLLSFIYSTVVFIWFYHNWNKEED